MKLINKYYFLSIFPLRLVLIIQFLYNMPPFSGSRDDGLGENIARAEINIGVLTCLKFAK